MGNSTARSRPVGPQPPSPVGDPQWQGSIRPGDKVLLTVTHLTNHPGSARRPVASQGSGCALQAASPPTPAGALSGVPREAPSVSTT